MTYQEARKEWIKALRSGEYLQASGFLSIKEEGILRHCCLGVACELYNKLNEDKLDKVCVDSFNSEVFNIPPSDNYSFRYDNEKYCLPEKVQKWLNIDVDGTLNKPINLDDEFGTYSSLITMNDTGKTFSEIADVIEKNLVKDLS